MTAPTRWFPAAVAVVAAVSFLRCYPPLVAFASVSFGDQGWPLAVDSLLDDGWTPTREFGYFYCLLTLEIDRAWFAAVGRTPWTAAALTAVGTAFLAVGLIRFANAAQLGPAARLVLLAAVPFAVMPFPYPSPMHAIEPALLVNALAYQARGKPAAALVLATLAVFCKPGLGLVYGLVLGLLVLAGGGGWKGRIRALLPAAVVGLAVACGLAARYGWGPVAETLFPLRAAQTYREAGYGFFSAEGFRFWLPLHVGPAGMVAHYLLTPAGFWLTASVLLLVGAVRQVGRLRDPVAATVVTCGVLHVAFVLVMFGTQWSWLYYSAVLVCGLAAVVPEPAAGGTLRWRTGTLVGLAVLGMFGPVVASLVHWGTWEERPETAGLYAHPDDAAAWGQVREQGRRGVRVLVFTRAGAAGLLFPELDAPRSWFLLRSTATPAEVDRVTAQLRAAQLLVIPRADRDLYPDLPGFREELERAFEPAGAGLSFRVLRRVRPPAGGPAGGGP
jgi:hypothetical protein